MIIEGEQFNISFSKDKVLRGWWVIKTENNKFFVVRQNFYVFSLKFFCVKREVYQIDESIENFLVPGKDIIAKTNKKMRKIILVLQSE